MVKILILGGGFAGTRVALDLEKRMAGKVNITLIDKNNYHLFAPSLYEVASAYGIARDIFSTELKKTIGVPFGDIFEDKKIDFVQADVVNIDLKNKKIFTAGDHALDYDYLIITLGAQSSDFNIPGVKEYAYQFKNLEDALAVKEKIERLFDEATRGERTLPIKIIIAGGGFTGIELSSEIGCCAKKLAKQCGFDGRCYYSIIVEAGSKILPMASDKERDIITKQLTKNAVQLMPGETIEEVGSDLVKLKSGKIIKGDIVIWTAGVKPNELLKKIKGFDLDQRGRLIVDDNLIVKNYENIFGAGDNIVFIDSETQKPIPAMAHVAIDQAKIIAKNIDSKINGKNLIKYKPSYGSWVVPIGGKFAIAHLWRGVSISGFWGWVIRELVDLRHMMSILPIFKALKLFFIEAKIFTRND